VFPIRSVRRAAVVLAVALSGSLLQAGCAMAKPAAACTPQPVLKTEPLELVTSRGRTRLRVEMANTGHQQEVGMMCRTALAPDRGMLFDFHSPKEVAFWMHNTLIPLDMVFIGADGRVFSIASARPRDDTPVPAGGPVRAVLEIPGGRAAQLGLLPGDRVLHRIFPK
jgi:uncharacterized membrane protein (UPF0127 family)